MKFLGTKKAAVIVSLLGLFLISTGISWVLFSFLKSEPDLVSKEVGESRSRIDPNLPKTEECPINGKMYSEPERAIWEERRPITAIIENHLDSRPQSGLSRADVVYETVAEGGITRFLTVFYCGASADEVKISPIRSARVYFIDWASEYSSNPIFVHVGGANNICKNCPGGVKPFGDVARDVDAFRMLDRLGWRGAQGNAFDGGTNVGYPIVVRDQYRLGEKAAWEHSVVGSIDKIFEEAAKRGFAFENAEGEAWDEDFVKWKFTDPKPLDSPVATEVSFVFWDNKGDYDVTWKYDKSQNSYLRFNGGKEHVDHETGKQISAKNLIILKVAERGPVDKEGHMFYTTIGTGDALIFQNGNVTEGIWKKRAQDDRTLIADDKGNEVDFVRGEIWFEAIPKGNEVRY